MKKAFTSLLACFALLVSSASVFGQQSLTISNGSVVGLQATILDIDMESTANTEGFVIAAQYDTALISVLALHTAGTATESAGAELVVPEIFEATGGFTLGVVLDSTAPFAGQVIPAGTSTIAKLEVMADVLVTTPTTTQIDFVDGVLNSPPLSNLLVQGGLSVEASNGLGLNGSTLELQVGGLNSLTLADATITPGGAGSAEVLMDNSSGAVQGFVLAVRNDTGIQLEEINIAGTVTEAVGAEFVVDTLYPASNGGTLGVVLDFNTPYDGQEIPVGSAQHIANFVYSCVNTPVSPSPAESFDIEFIDGLFGSPSLDNVIVVGGLSLNPDLISGVVSCEAAAAGDTSFYCGIKVGDQIVDPTGAPGEVIEFCFFWSDPSDNIHGFQIAACFDCDLHFVEGTLSTADTILEEVGAEFVNHHVDNDPQDGDGCEIVIGILLDAVPPFDRQTVPPTVEPLRIACIDVEIDANAACNTCLDVTFCNGINGRGSVAITNTVVINTVESITEIQTHACQVCVVAEPEFIRGDCNFDMRVDIADASTVLAQQFQGYIVACEDSCDPNDDGKINLADTVFILNYMFKFGTLPLAPFPQHGSDDTVDDPSGLHGELGCVNGIDPCP